MTICVSLDFPQCVVVNCFSMFVDCLAFCAMLLMCWLYVSFVSNVRPSIFGVCVTGRGVLFMLRLMG